MQHQHCNPASADPLKEMKMSTNISDIENRIVFTNYTHGTFCTVKNIRMEVIDGYLYNVGEKPALNGHIKWHYEAMSLFGVLSLFDANDDSDYKEPLIEISVGWQNEFTFERLKNLRTEIAKEIERKGLGYMIGVGEAQNALDYTHMFD